MCECMSMCVCVCARMRAGELGDDGDVQSSEG